MYGCLRFCYIYSMIEKLRENKKLVYIGIGGILITIIVVIILILLSSPSEPSNSGIVTPPNNTVDSTPTTDDVDPGDVEPDPGDEQPTSGTIKWWGTFLSEEDVAPIIENYEAENPGVTIEYTNQVIAQSEIPSYQTKLLDNISDEESTTAPDIFMIDNGWSGLFEPNLAPAPDDVISASQLRNNFYDFVSTDFVTDEKVYGLPLWVDTYAFVYNKDMYEAENLVSPDADWQKFVDDQVPVLTKTSNNQITQAGFSAAIPKNSEFWFEALNMLMLQNKVAMVDNSGQAIFGNDVDAQDALDFYSQFEDSNQSWDSSFNLDIATFLEGKLATYMAPTWRLNDVIRYNKLGNLGLDIGISAVPQLSSSAGSKANFASYWGNVVNENSAVSAQAWDFINYLTQAQQLETLNREMKNNGSTEVGILYPRKDMASQQSNDQYLGVYVSSLATAKSWPMKDELQVKEAFRAIFDGSADLSDVEEEVNNI